MIHVSYCTDEWQIEGKANAWSKLQGPFISFTLKVSTGWLYIYTISSFWLVSYPDYCIVPGKYPRALAAQAPKIEG